MSQYVLSVNPPTSDCQSSPDCEVMDGSSSVYNRSGTETQYSLTVATQEYDITVRAETCAGSLTAESSVYTVNLTDENLGICLVLPLVIITTAHKELLFALLTPLDGLFMHSIGS